MNLITLRFVHLIKHSPKRSGETLKSWCPVLHVHTMAIKGKACWLLDNTSPLLWALVSSFSFLPFPSLSHPPNNTHAPLRVHALFSSSMYYCPFLCSQPFSRRPVGLLLLLLFSEVWLFLHIKQEHYTDVATCAMAALHNPGLRLCWLNRPVFTQAPHGCFGTLSPLLHWSGVWPFTLVAAWGFRRRGDSGLTCKPPDGIFFATWTAKWQINNSVL